LRGVPESESIDIAAGDDSTSRSDETSPPNSTPKPLARNAEKRRKADGQRLGDIKNTLHVIIDTIKKTPRLWLASFCDELRDFYRMVSGDPITYPPALPVSDSLPAGNDDSKLPSLTPGFATGIYARRYDQFRSDAPVPVVKVMSIDIKHREHEYKAENRTTIHQQPQFTLHVTDGDGGVLTVRANSSLTYHMGMVKVGTLLKLLQYAPIYYDYGNRDDLRVMILMSNFEIVGWGHVDDDWEPPEADTRVVQERIDREVAEMNAIDVDGEDEDNNGDAVPPCLDGARCSIHGIQFGVCICKSYPVDNLVLSEIAKTCHFVTMPIAEMPNNFKRNMIYWWYATNIYLVCGKHNRVALPDCLVWEVRRCYPNPTGVPYKGHEEKRRRLSN
jgi:hypothetical protein